MKLATLPASWAASSPVTTPMVRREARRSMLAVSAASPASQDSSSVRPAESSGSSAPADSVSPSPTNVCHSSSKS
eukprot:4880808-Pleurochrysis_carterae.AAC.1